MNMKKQILVIAILILVSVLAAQPQKVDFRSADYKLLNAVQKREYQAWREQQFRLMKSNGLQSEVKSLVIQGNKIKSIIYNTGAISNPGVTGNVLDLVWNGLGYGYEFGPLVGVRVPNPQIPSDSFSIVIDGFGGANRSTADGDFAPDGTTKWGWLPKSGYSASGQNDLASWGARGIDLRFRPSSWPESWFNSTLGEYIYPSFLGGNSTVPDEEVYYVVDDATDKEFSYKPFPADTTIGGLGLNLEVRTFQFSNPLAEDIIFLVYTAENASPKTLKRVFFGMFGDPHVGGPSNFNDDAASFVPARTIGIPSFDKLIVINNDTVAQRARNLVYTWDPDNLSDIPGRAPGYFGYKFLESPNNSTDGIDNDDDGILDEGPFNDKGAYIDGVSTPLNTGINNVSKYTAIYGTPKPRWAGDEDGDWDVTRDDLGVDGIAGTNDFGEGNGVPDQLFGAGGSWLGSEPNFGFRDVNESDMIGLRSFWSLTWGGSNRPKNDNLMYSLISSEMDTAALGLLYTSDPDNVGDYIFLYGSGPFDMPQGHRERYSIALLMGLDLRDLILNSETAQLVLEANYRFAQPPPKPTLTAVAGNGRVTLYWDTKAENSIDPLTNTNDFEGYKIYRSRDYTFKDVFTISDGFGNPFLGEPLYDNNAQKAAQWHRPWTQQEKDTYVGGFHPSEYRGRYVKYYLGEPNDATGLRHEYVDSTVTNGVQYYYAVVSYDHGEVARSLPPSESQSIIIRDAVTQQFKYDVNTVGVVPNALGAGIVSTKDDILNGRTILHSGNGTGRLVVKPLNEELLTTSEYRVSMDTTLVNAVKTLTYSARKVSPVVVNFIGNETLFVNLSNKNIIPTSLRIFNGPDTTAAVVDMAHLVLDSINGRVKAKAIGTLLKTRTYSASYQYYPVYRSAVFDAKDANQVFDGIRLYLTNDVLAFDEENHRFSPKTPDSLVATVANPTLGSVKYAPLDIRIQFTISTADTNTAGNYIAPADSFGTQNPASKTVRAPFRVLNATDTIPLQVLIKDGGVPPAKLGRWDIGEEIIILTPAPHRLVANNTMMGITFRKSLAAKNTPKIDANTSFIAKMKKPFTNADAFIFTTSKISYDAAKADAELEKIIVVPNPYVVYSQFELPTYRPTLRGDRALQFRNLPKECTIRIYSMVGELVQTIVKNDNLNYANWDLLSSESARIGYGVYIYHVETPTGGTKIGRIGIIK
jgi:hypothetical protein